MNASLLVELQTEELPPKALSVLSEAFAAGIERGLRTRHLLAPDSQATAYGAPRRLGVLITDVLAASPAQAFKQKLVPVSVGIAPDGSATPALLKKLAALGIVAGVDQLRRESDGKTEQLVVEGVKPGVALAAGLQAALLEAIEALPIPKVMSYQLADGHSTVQFVRPVQHLVALHGTEVVPVSALGLAAGRTTRGHRFHTSAPIQLASAEGYAAQLESEGRVIASFAARRARLVELVQAAAARLGATPIMPAELVDEVNALTEWPTVYESGFEREFLEVPEECLILTMQQNQKYFALRGADGRLTNTFLLASHIEAVDGGAAIRSGNARVVRARLADAKFFYDQDRRQTLESRIPGLAHVVYHNKLGSQLERVERVVGIAVAIGRGLGADETHVERAARLAKADLRTLMVGEFPELQGVMGEYYAHHDGEAADVALAIREHYQPRFAGDALPASRVSLAVALADKLETLAGLFGIGQVPTGDKDPYALRRHALGVLRMLIERDLPLALPELVDTAFAAFGPAHGQAQAQVSEFLFDRLVGYLRDAGYTLQEIDAVVALRPPRWGDIPRRLAAVRAFSQLPEAASLAAANKRIGNILKKATEPVPASYRAELLLEPAEQQLAAALERVAPGVEALAARGEYEALLRSLAPLKLPVDAFFDEVMVNVDDVALRANRLALLARLHAAMNRVADLARLSS
ncbi:MAG TPA: glycine--tRNA ligase subunit beta [Burkholderiaceae bacterium]|nr:glycine--tRNA ligase subunit beta [Burkholderiaceae bacterium]